MIYLPALPVQSDVASQKKKYIRTTRIAYTNRRLAGAARTAHRPARPRPDPVLAGGQRSGGRKQ